jgi:hypothetical protein
MQPLRRYILLIAVFVLGATASLSVQNWRDNLTFKGFSRVTHLSTSGANIYVKIDNSSIWRYVIKSGEVDILINGNRMVTFSLRDKVVIPRRKCSEILIPVRFKAQSSFALSRLLWRIISLNGDDIELSYRLRAGIGCLQKSFKEDDISMSKIFDIFAEAKSLLEELWNMIR